MAKVATRDGRRLVGAVVSLCEHSMTVALAGYDEPLVLPVDEVIRAVIVSEEVSS